MKILLIEDNPADVAMIREMLPAKSGDSFQIINERTLSAGLDMLLGGAFDLILLDMGLPDSIGIDTVQTVIRHASHKPVVVLTGLDDEQAGMQSLQEGAQDYLVKGQITASTLVRAIRYAQERSRIEHELICKNADLDAINEELTAAGEELRQSLGELTLREQELHESEDRFHQLVEGVQDYAIITLDTEGTITTWNEGARRIMGYVADEIIGKNFSGFHPSDNSHREEVKNGLSIAAAEGRYEIEGWEVRKDGSRIWADTVITPLKGSRGDLTGFSLITRDLTVRRRTEQSLYESEQRLKRSQEIAHLGSWELDLTRGILTWSDEAYRIFGLKPQEFDASYEAFLESVHPDDRAMVDAAYSGSVRDGKNGYEIEHRVVRRGTGEVRYVHEKCDHIRDEKGTIVRSVGMVHDITERKMAEEENLRARKEWERTFDSVPDLIAILDKEHRIIRANRAMAERLGTIPDKLTGRFCYDVLHSAQCPPEQCPHEMTCRDLQQHIIEMYEPKLSGEFLVSTTPLFDQDGRLEEIVHVARDITERRQTEIELEHYAERLKLSNQDLERFAYVASHDLREPLRMVTSFAQLLSERYKGKLDADADEFIDYIVDGGTRMDALVNDLLDYSRVTFRSKPMEMTDMNGPVNEALNNMSISIKERGARISVDLLPQAMVDRSQMALVFQNLISNSMKFCREDIPEISICSSPRGDEVVFSVSDNGIGIDPEYHQKIFEIFQRLHTRGEYSGTGIGLAICRRIVERHGGRIWVESKLGEGSTFFFTISSERDMEAGNFTIK